MNSSSAFAHLLIAAIFAFGAPAAWATDPLPGGDVSLRQVPGGIFATAATDDTGTMSFYNLPSGNYVLYLSSKTPLTKFARMSNAVAGGRPVLSDALAPPPPDGRGRASEMGTPVTKDGKGLVLVVPVDTRPTGKNYESTRSKISKKPGLPPPGIYPGTTIVVVLTADAPARQ